MNEQQDLKTLVQEQGKVAKRAAHTLQMMTPARKIEALAAMAGALWTHRLDILTANEADVQAARASGLSEWHLDRLMIDETRIRQMIEGLHQVAELPDPVGEVLETTLSPDGLTIEKVRVPMGVIAMIYESRPNVTVDAAGLAVKTGNAVILRGGKEALQTNTRLVSALQHGLAKAGLPPQAVQLIERVERETVLHLIQARGLVDLAIPRGGAGLITHVLENARVPVIETGVGNCHVYVDEHADPEKASAIVLNAKTQRPSVCNAMETLLVHEALAADWLPRIAEQLLAHQVRIRGCARTIAALNSVRCEHPHIEHAEPNDWATEYLDLILAVKIVRDLDEALDHIERYGTKHSEAIVTERESVAEPFLHRVDAAAVYHNASTRFTDGFEFGFGAEIGISTQKLHARGPMGLRELTSYKYKVRGNGHVRK